METQEIDEFELADLENDEKKLEEMEARADLYRKYEFEGGTDG